MHPPFGLVYFKTNWRADEPVEYESWERLIYDVYIYTMHVYSYIIVHIWQFSLKSSDFCRWKLFSILDTLGKKNVSPPTGSPMFTVLWPTAPLSCCDRHITVPDVSILLKVFLHVGLVTRWAVAAGKLFQTRNPRCTEIISFYWCKMVQYK